MLHAELRVMPRLSGEFSPLPSGFSQAYFLMEQFTVRNSSKYKDINPTVSLNHSLQLIVMMGLSKSCGIVCDVSLHHSNYSGKRMMSGLYPSE